MKKGLIGLWGIVQGAIGAVWNMIGLLFILHPDSSPGSKDWEEDVMFIPVGYIMLVIWLIAMFLSYYILRKNKNNVLVFSVAWLVSMIACVVLLLVA